MSVNYYSRSGGPYPDLTVHAPDISLLGYEPDNDYELENLDNWNRRSLMDKGPEENIMEDDYVGPDARRAQAQFSRSRLDMQYLGEDKYPQRNGELDLNDYTMEFARGEDNGTMQQAVVKDSWDRIKKTQQFKRDPAMSIMQGRQNPFKENEDVYKARLSALKMRQEFYMEKTNLVRATYKPLSKGSLGYDPMRTVAVEHDIYENEHEYDNGGSRGKVFTTPDNISGLHGGLKDAEFNTDSVFNKVKMIMNPGDVRIRSRASVTMVDSENFDGDDNTVETLVRSQCNAVRRMAAVARYRDDHIFQEEESKLATMMRMFSDIKGRSAAAKGKVTDTVFEDDIEMDIRAPNKAVDSLNKLVNAIRDDVIPDGEIEMAIRYAARDQRRKSGFYHKACTDDTLGFNDDIEMNVRTTGARKGRRRIDPNNDGEFGSDTEEQIRSKPVKNYKTSKIGKHSNQDGMFEDNQFGLHDGKYARRRKTRNDYYNTEYGGVSNFETTSRNNHSVKLSKRGRNHDLLAFEDEMQA